MDLQKYDDAMYAIDLYQESFQILPISLPTFVKDLLFPLVLWLQVEDAATRIITANIIYSARRFTPGSAITPFARFMALAEHKMIATVQLSLWW